MNITKSERFSHTPHDISLSEFAIGTCMVDEKSTVAAAKQKLKNISEKIAGKELE
jgi:hypothetical protein